MSYLSKSFSTLTILIENTWNQGDDNFEIVWPKVLSKRKELGSPKTMLIIPYSGKLSGMLIEECIEKNIAHMSLELGVEIRLPPKANSNQKHTMFGAQIALMNSTHCLIFHNGDTKSKALAKFARQHKVDVASVKLPTGGKKGRKRTRTRRKR